MRTADFQYPLPTRAIAQRPVEPRDAARLLVASTLEDRRFADLPDLLRPGDLVVVNATRVRRARLHGRKASGGTVEALLLSDLGEGIWEGLVRPARKIRAGTRLIFGDLEATVLEDPDEGRTRLALAATDGDVEATLARIGEIPLPPYIHVPLEDPERYQTVYARTIGSAAAPTAGLHFTTRLLDRLAEAGIGLATVDLGVSADTFRPIKAANIEDHVMHAEHCRVPTPTADAITSVRQGGGRVVAVGTTVTRALETAARDDGAVEAVEGETHLYIRPGFRFRVVDLLVTNFHTPGSTLVVMVAAFMGPAWRTAYETALGRGYRFLSFGDAMLAERGPEQAR